MGRARGFFALAVVVFVALFLAPQQARAQNPLERLMMPGELIDGHAKFEKECSSCHVPFSQAGQDELCIKCHKPIASDLANKRGMHFLRKDVSANPCRHCHTEHKGRKADIVQLDPRTFDHGATNFTLSGKHQSAPCASCHVEGKKYREAPAKCADCHKSSDVHGGQLGSDCATCHAADAWPKIKPFDHKATKFALTGTHGEVPCRSCHAGERYKSLPVTCDSCHRSQDVHHGRNGEKCAECHKTSKWWDVAFDHDKNTKFPLIGKHADTGCGKCHQQDPHRVKVETDCLACHKKDDVHKGELGKDCLKCHGEANWKKDTRFDHALTRFPLRGKHADAKCDACHKTKIYKDAPLACKSCHEKKDRESHDGRLGGNCGQCHNVSEWKGARFDHNKTRFKLIGRHSTTGCHSCHRERHKEKATLATDCYSCHKASDQHRGAFGRDCGKCHTPFSFGTAFIRK